MKQSVTTHPRTIRLSESALTVEFGESIDLQTNEMVLAFAAAVEHATIRGLVEVVPTYRSATVYFNHLLTDAVTLTKRLQELMSEANTPPPRPPTIHTISLRHVLQARLIRYGHGLICFQASEGSRCRRPR